jgi:hypothetical protein
MDSIIMMFKEIGFSDDSERDSFNKQFQYDFDFGKSNQNEIEIITSNNTKIEELCPIGTK